MKPTFLIAVLTLFFVPPFLLASVTASASGDCQGDGSCDEVSVDANATTGPVSATTGAATATNAGIVTTTKTEVPIEVGLQVGGPVTQVQNTEAVRVAPAFGTTCYESMNASLLDKGVSIGSANKICQALQIVDVWFALAAVTEDPVLAKTYTDEGLKILRKTTRLVNRGLAWHNVKSFFQEIGVPVGIIVLLVG